MPRCFSDNKTRTIIEEIFSHPPVNQAELELRISAVEVDVARSVLIKRLCDGGISEQDGPLFAAVFDHLGVGQERAALIDIAQDRSCDSHVRAHAMSVLAEEEPEDMENLMDQLDPDDVEPLAELSLIELLATIQADPEQADAVVYVLESTPLEMQEYMLDQIEDCRIKAGTEAVAAYVEVLKNRDFGHLRSRILKAIMAEGGAQGIALLEQLRDQARDPVEHRQLQRALLSIRTRAIDPQNTFERPQGFSYLGTCDGQGAYFLIGCFKNPDNSLTIADLCIRCAADIRDGFVLPRSSDEDVEQIVGEIRKELGTGFVRISMDEAAMIVRDAVDRTRRCGLTVPENAQPAVAKFEAARNPQYEEPPACEAPAAGRLTLKRVRALLDRREYRDAWFFDVGDLDGAGVDLPRKRGRVAAEWYHRAACKLDSPRVGHRLVEMARFIGRWHRWNNEPAEAVLCDALARSTKKDFSSSPLVRVMLERSLEPMRCADQEMEEKSFGGAFLRQHLKALFFQEVDKPRAKDLALLDLTEAALVSLDSIFDSLPGESRPREDERYSIAYSMGRMFVEFLLSEDEDPFEILADLMMDELEQISRLTMEEREHVVLMVLPALVGYSEQICAECNLDCFSRPGSRVEDIFFSPGHPLELQYRDLD